MNPTDSLKEYAKGVVAFLVAVVLGGIAQGLIVGAAAMWLTIIIGALTTAGVVAARNKVPPKKPKRARDAGLGLLEVIVILLVVVVFLLAIGWLGPHAAR